MYFDKERRGFTEYLTNPFIILTFGQEYPNKALIQVTRAAFNSFYSGKLLALLLVSDARDCAEFYAGFKTSDRKDMKVLMHDYGVSQYELSEPLPPLPTASLI